MYGGLSSVVKDKVDATEMKDDSLLGDSGTRGVKPSGVRMRVTGDDAE